MIREQRQRAVILALTVVYLVCVGMVTLRPAVPSESGWVGRVLRWLGRWPPTGWIGLDGLEFGSNIVLFVPFGMVGAALLGLRRWWLVMALGVATTCGIELAQRAIPYRFSDPGDVVANTAGAALGLVATAVMLSEDSAVRLWSARRGRRRGSDARGPASPAEH